MPRDGAGVYWHSRYYDEVSLQGIHCSGHQICCGLGIYGVSRDGEESTGIHAAMMIFSLQGRYSIGVEHYRRPMADLKSFSTVQIPYHIP